MKKFATYFLILLSLLMGVASFIGGGSDADASSDKTDKDKIVYDDSVRPIVYFIGGQGSAAQFNTMAQYYMLNGYPPDHLTVFEYNTQVRITDMEAFNKRIDAHIDAVLAETGHDKVDFVGKTPSPYGPGSIPGVTMYYLLSSAERRAKVAHVVYQDSALDGYEAVEGIPTLAIWGDRMGGSLLEDREIIGAENVKIPGQDHIETESSVECFVHAYTFLNDKAPTKLELVPERGPKVSIAGKTSIWPDNIGLEGSKLEIYEINGDTGHRIKKHPDKTALIGADGLWGPFNLRNGAYYEFMVVHPNGELHPHYYEPFTRSNYLVRLLTGDESLPNGGSIGSIVGRSETRANMLIFRVKEFWGDPSVDNDFLFVNGVNIVNPSTCPLMARTATFIVYDRYDDGISNPDKLAFRTGYIVGVDLHVPGSYPPDSTISYVLFPRGGGDIQTLNVPNWASSKVRRISVTFRP